MKLLIKKYNISKWDFLFVLGLFILVYNPPLFNFNTMHIVGLLSIFYLAVSNVGIGSFRIAKRREDAHLFYGFIAIFVYLLVVVVCLHSQSIASVAFPIYFLIDIIPFAMAMKKFAEKHDYSVNWAIDMALHAAALQGVFALLAFIVPTIQQYFVSRMVAYGYSDVYLSLSSYRMYGFSNALTNATPVIQSILAVVAISRLSVKGMKYYLVAALLFFSAIINARVSIIVLLVGIVILLLLSRYPIKKKIQLLLTIGLVIVVIFEFVLPTIKRNSPLTYEWITQGMEELTSFLGGTKSGYFSYLYNKERLTLPSDLYSVILGKGYSIMTTGNISGIQSDIGYINDVWIGGVLYILLTYSFFARIMLRLAKNKNRTLSFLGLYYLVVVPILNVKGMAFTMNAFLNFLIIIYCFRNLPTNESK